MPSVHDSGKADGIYDVYDRRSIGCSPMGAGAGKNVSSEAKLVFGSFAI